MSSKIPKKQTKQEETELEDSQEEKDVFEGTPMVSTDDNAQAGGAVKALLGKDTWKNLDSDIKKKLIAAQRALESQKRSKEDVGSSSENNKDSNSSKSGDLTPPATLLTSDLKLLGGEAAMNFGFVPTKDQILKFKNDLESKAASNIKISIDRRNSLMSPPYFREFSNLKPCFSKIRFC